MQQTVLARHNLYETSIRHDRANYTVVDLTNLRDCNDSLDLADCSIDAILVRSRYLNLTYTVNLVDSDGSASILLHLLDDLTTRANNSTDELLRNLELYDTWNLWLHLCTWLSDCVGEALQDVLTTSLSLHQSLLEDVEAQTVALDIHLGGCQTVLCTSGLEVHIAQVVLVAKDIAKYSILIFTRILDQSHCDTRNRLLHWNTSVHQGECTSTYCSH